MAPRPTKTPILSHQHSQNPSSRFPAPQHPNAANQAHVQHAPLQSSASQPNLYDPSREAIVVDTDMDSNENPDNKPVYQRSKSCFRWIVLFLSCWAMFGSYYCYDNPTALATQIKDHYNLSSTKYNLLYSVYSFPNVILPLFGGALVDKIGAETSLLVFLCLVTAGQALFAFAASISNYPLMLVARAVYGLGGESLCVAESALLAVYFAGTEVAFAMGLNLSIGRAGSSLNDYATLRIYNLHGSIPEALWAGFLLLCICLAATVVMVVLDRMISRKRRNQGYFVPEAHSGEIVQLSDIREFNILYWLLTISCIVVYGCVLPWNNIGGAFMQSQYNFAPSKSNTYLMVPYLLSAGCVPVFGYICDRLGRRSELLIVSTLALTMTHAIFAWFTSIDPIYALCLMGVAYSIYASAIWPAVSLVVNEAKLGTAYGFITSVQNGGLALFPIIVGKLTGSDSSSKQYYWVEIFFFALGAFGVLIGVLLWVLDTRGDAVLAKPSIQKEAANNDGDKEENMKTKLLSDQEGDDDANISLQATPDLLNEEYEKGRLEKTPVVLKQDQYQ